MARWKPLKPFKVVLMAGQRAALDLHRAKDDERALAPSDDSSGVLSVIGPTVILPLNSREKRVCAGL